MAAGRELVGWLRFAWTTLTSMRTALLLLLVLGIAAVPGSLLPQRPSNPVAVSDYVKANPGWAPWLDRLGFFDVFGSAWFAAIYLLLFLSLVGCVLPRTRHHLTALRAAPPRTPARLERLPAHTSRTIAGDPEDALGAAERLLDADPDLLETAGSAWVGPVQDQKVAVVGGGGVGESPRSTARIDVVDLATRKVEGALPSGEDPEFFALHPDGRRLFVSNENDDEVSVVDIETRAVTGSVGVGVEPEGIAASPDGRFVVNTSETTSMIHIIDAATLELLDNVLVDTRPRVAQATAFRLNGPSGSSSRHRSRSALRRPSSSA